MISISGIKFQKELETLACFNKHQASVLIGKKGKNLDKKIEHLKKIGYLLNLKKGIYTTSFFYQTVDRNFYIEYIANILRSPSYISLEYVLEKEGLIPETVLALTSMTSKSSRTFTNFLGNFIYRSVKEKLFIGFIDKLQKNKKIYIAKKSKALFDFLYLKKFQKIDPENIKDLRINWVNFSKTDFKEFSGYVKFSKSKKMAKILKIIAKNTYAY